MGVFQKSLSSGSDEHVRLRRRATLLVFTTHLVLRLSGTGIQYSLKKKSHAAGQTDWSRGNCRRPSSVRCNSEAASKHELPMYASARGSQPHVCPFSPPPTVHHSTASLPRSPCITSVRSSRYKNHTARAYRRVTGASDMSAAGDRSATLPPSVSFPWMNDPLFSLVVLLVLDRLKP